jgi:hypothetical protein
MSPADHERKTPVGGDAGDQIEETSLRGFEIFVGAQDIAGVVQRRREMPGHVGEGLTDRPRSASGPNPA